MKNVETMYHGWIICIQNEFNFENSQEGHLDANCHPQIGSKVKPRVSKSYANFVYSSPFGQREKTTTICHFLHTHHKSFDWCMKIDIIMNSHGS